MDEEDKKEVVRIAEKLETRAMILCLETTTWGMEPVAAIAALLKAAQILCSRAPERLETQCLDMFKASTAGLSEAYNVRKKNRAH